MSEISVLKSKKEVAIQEKEPLAENMCIDITSDAPCPLKSSPPTSSLALVTSSTPQPCPFIVGTILPSSLDKDDLVKWANDLLKGTGFEMKCRTSKRYDQQNRLLSTGGPRARGKKSMQDEENGDPPNDHDKKHWVTENIDQDEKNNDTDDDSDEDAKGCGYTYS